MGSSGRSGSVISLLYLDDEPALLDIGKVLLEQSGEFQVTTVADATNAVGLISQNRFDAIVSDYQMPGMNGIEFLKYVRARNDTIPFIIFTGRGREEIAIEALNSGADFYIRKGGDPRSQFAELANAIRHAVSRKRAEEALRENEARYREFFTTSRDSVFITSPEGRWIDFNEAMLGMFGYSSREELFAVPVSAIYANAKERPGFLALIEKKGYVQEYPLQGRRRDGTTFDLLVTTVPVRNPDGSVRAFIGTIRDVTDRKRAIEALQESEQRYHNIIEDQTEFICRFRPDGTHVFVNNAYASYFGKTRDELIGHVFQPNIFAEDRERIRQFFASLTPDHPLDYIEHRIIMPGGEIRWQRWSDRAIFDDAGSLVEYQSVGRDVTLQKKTEEALRESEERFRTLFEQSPFPYQSLDAEGMILEVNRAWLATLGYSHGEVIGRWFGDFLIPDDVAPFRQQYEKFKQAGQVHDSIRILRRKDGSTMIASIEGKIDYNPDSSFRQTHCIISDITGQKKAEAALRESEERYRGLFRDDLTGDIIIGPEGTILECNPAFVSMYGFPEEQAVLGSDFRTFFKIREEYGEILQKIRQEQKGVFYTGQQVRYDGQTIDIEGRIAGIFDAAGTLAAVKGYFYDVTDRNRAEEALRESEETYRTTFENTGTAMVTIEQDRTIILANGGFVELSGFSKEEIEGKKKWTEFVVRDDLERMLAQHRLRRKEREAALKNYQFRFIRRDGSIRDIYLSIDVIPGTSKSIASLLDVTDRERALQGLRESEARLQAILQGSPIPKFVIDKNHTVISWNRALEETTGIPAKDMLGTTQHWRAFYEKERPSLADLLVDEETEQIAEFYGEKIRRSAIIEGGYEATNFFPHLGTQGKWLNYMAAPIRDTSGQIIGAVETLEDITVQKQAEAALRESEQRYHNIIEDQTEFICRFKPDGTHVFVNDAYARYFGKVREEMIGKIFRPNIFPEDLKRVGQFFESLTPDHPVDYVEHRIIMPDGEVRWQRWSDRAIFDDAGSLVEYQSVGRDVTAQKEVDEELRKANHQIMVMNSITRHDIINKITIILGYLTLLQRKSPDPAINDYLKKIESATSAIRDQIEFTRDYQELGGHKPQWQELNRILVRQQIPPSITLQAEVQGVWVYADRMLEKVFFNLLDNSIMHGKKVTKIRVSQQRSGNDLTIVWEDNGVGIPAGEKELIFERGFGKNTGLGMFLAREILAITGISVTETGDTGSGARFEISVPEGRYRISPALSDGQPPVENS